MVEKTTVLVCDTANKGNTKMETITRVGKKDLCFISTGLSNKNIESVIVF
jgi:hypothetical protein